MFTRTSTGALLWDGKETTPLALLHKVDAALPRRVQDAPGRATHMNKRGLTWGHDEANGLQAYIQDSAGTRVYAVGDICGTDPRRSLDWEETTHTFVRDELVAAGWMPA